MDFTSDRVSCGGKKKFRVFGVLDDYSREALCLLPATSITSKAVIAVLERLARQRGCYPKALRCYPKALRCDNGPELISTALGIWA